MSMPFRIGYGYDVHQLAPGEDFWLGGIQIEHSHGAVGHSDADVLLHVICDALLGALSMRDIGFHFPDTDLQYKGVDSKKLLQHTYDLITEAGWKLGNVDTTVSLQEPKISSHVNHMRGCIAGLLGVDLDQVSIKATTTEKLGFVGAKEGISAHAVVLLQRPA
jgi:2-C-methyl-D-erythritol 2,4-cyclodiphosphate synthase